MGEVYGAFLVKATGEPYYDGQYKRWKYPVSCIACGSSYVKKDITLRSSKRFRRNGCGSGCRRLASHKAGAFLGVYEIMGYLPEGKLELKCSVCSSLVEGNPAVIEGVKYGECRCEEIKDRGKNLEIGIFYFNRTKCRARAKGLEFSITREDMSEQIRAQEYRCALSGMVLDVPRKSTKTNKNTGTASIDRIDSRKGYTPENIQWVHKYINQIKSDLDQDQFIYLCKKVAERNEQSENLCDHGLPCEASTSTEYTS